MIVLALGFALASPPEIRAGVYALLSHQCQAVMGWRWQADDGAPDANLGGVIANALLDAYARRPDAATWMTLVQYADYLRTRYAEDEGLPYKADVEFLARLGATGMEPSAMVLARSLFERVRHVSATGAAEYQRISAGRADTPEIIGYDVALAMRAAQAVGDTVYAHELASAAIAGSALALADATDSFAVTALGALLQALARLDAAAYHAAITDTAARLARAQAEDGSWANHNTQATAYAVLGLLETKSDTALEAAARGKNWLLRSQLRTGAWPAYHDGLAEPFVGPVLPLVEAEALAALLE